MILVGSRAIKYWFPDFPREPKDWDWVTDDVTQPKPTNGRHEYLSNDLLLFSHPFSKVNACDPDYLYTLKISHLFWDIKWDKHMFDVQFLKKKGCKIIPFLFDALYQYWNEVHGPNKRSNLTLSAEEFFDNALKDKYDHDYIHTLIAEVPAYTKVLKDGSEVESSEEKFNAMSHQEKLELVREEIMVMAYERRGGRPYYVAYSWMLKRFIRNHAPIWEALWIIDNFLELYKPTFNYVKKLDDELSRNPRSC